MRALCQRCPVCSGNRLSLANLLRQFDHLDEHRGPIELEVHGTIPSWAAGSLFRTGPGLRRIENTPKGTLDLTHWFDGLAHIHKFDIIANHTNPRARVVYSSRRQSDNFVNYVQRNGLKDIITFGQKVDPCVGIFAKVMTSWSAAKPDRETKELENASVTVQLDVPGLPSSINPEDGHPLRQTVWLGTDAHFIREVNPSTLEPVGFVKQDKLHKSLKGQLSCAHAQRCPLSGDYFNVNIKGGRKATYKVFRVSTATGRTDILAELSYGDLPLAYIHSFYLTRNFVILRLPSSHISAHGLSILWKKNLLEAMEPFNDKKFCQWFVVDRHHGKGVVAKFKTEASFFFHTVNSYEELVAVNPAGSPRVTLVMDTIEYKSLDILDALRYDVLMNVDGKTKDFWAKSWMKTTASLPRFVRREITIPLPQAPQPPPPLAASIRVRAAAVTKNTIGKLCGRRRHRPADYTAALNDNTINITTPHIGELPTINPAYHTNRYRYVYSLAMGCRSTFVDTIVKTDLETDTVQEWNNPIGHTPGEGIYVGRPGAIDEDDGVLLSVVLDGSCNKSYLLCLDAKNMQELGRANMDFAVGFGFHGVHTVEV